MKKNLKHLLIVLFLIGILITIYFLNKSHLLTLENIKAQKDYLQAYVAQNYWWSVCMFILFYMVETALALPGTALLTMLGGFLFGLWGFFFSIFAATIGATLTFLGVRYLVGNWVYERYNHKPLFKTIHDELHINAVYYLLFLRIVPFVPYFFVNIMLGLTEISVFTFLWTTGLGIIPGDILYTLAGKQLNTISSLYDIFSCRTILIFAILIAALVIPLIIKHLPRKK
ncbi:MAG: VTT domain-containing protein [Candidatus Babeliaceae bacterium]